LTTQQAHLHTRQLVRQPRLLATPYRRLEHAYVAHKRAKQRTVVSLGRTAITVKSRNSLRATTLGLHHSVTKSPTCTCRHRVVFVPAGAKRTEEHWMTSSNLSGCDAKLQPRYRTSISDGDDDDGKHRRTSASCHRS
jgi:hypothetical protein